jgi:adenine-specific DNA-methyltransferase
VAESTYDKFRRLLAELFMFDRADLDFGIYRIMNVKRDEVTRFLEDDLLPQVKTTLGEVDSGQRAQLQAELEEAEKAAALAGFDPDDSPTVQDLRQALKSTGDPDALEAEVFSDLYSFFRRYYKDGDFMSMRRYKEGVYAIPYEGEEVKLYWANHDQYYIKSGEYFRDYAFKLPDGRRVHFKLAAADEERDNIKAMAGQERRFILSEPDPVCEVDGELVIRFDYRPDAEKRKREELVTEAAAKVLGDEAAAAWLSGLAAASPTEKNPRRTLLEKHLNDYSARNTFDYFIHKDLGGFLRRELDFYIKNEVMHLDDIESEGEQRVVLYLAKIKAIRRIAHKIIDFLAQLEDFQKKLWLKKKFVVETNYCVTLDRVPEELYREIAANEAQSEEWVRLFAIDEIEGDLTQPAYSQPLAVEFLKANPSLVLDTAHFDREFKERLLASFDDLEEQTDGLLVRGENFQALNLLQERYREQVTCIYIDPPYNTGSDGFAYKDSYQHSSWAAAMYDRATAARLLLHARDGCLFSSIDDGGVALLRQVLARVFGDENFVADVIWQKKYAPANDATWLSDDHDFLVLYARQKAAWSPGRIRRDTRQDKAYSCPDADPRGAWKAGDYKCNKSADERPNLYYAITNPNSGKTIWPKRNAVWRYSQEQHERNTTENRVWWGRAGMNDVPAYKRFLSEVGDLVPRTIWAHQEVGHNQDGIRQLRDVLPETTFTAPKPTGLIERVGRVGRASCVLDFFAGSGTTYHAVINLNREDGGRRKSILVEMGDHFETVLIPRIKKATYAPEWSEGKPKRLATSEEVARGPHLTKYVRLESYEDALNNLTLGRNEDQNQLLAEHPDLREDFTLRYMLDVESEGSASLLNLAQFEDPFSYTLQIGQGSVGETRPVAVDLVETFNYLVGLRVRHVDAIRGFKVVEGASPQGERVLVIWRNTREKSNADLDEFFQKQGYNTRDTEFDVIYVNGDNNLENLRRPDETWKVRLIEDDFRRLMFDVEDV